MGLPRLKRVLCAALAALLLALASVALADVTVYVAPYSGTKYHSRKSCRGLNNARRIKAYKLSELPSKYKPCSICASGSKYQRSSSSSKSTKKPTAKPTSKPTAKPTALVAAAPYASPDPLATVPDVSCFDSQQDYEDYISLYHPDLARCENRTVADLLSGIVTFAQEHPILAALCVYAAVVFASILLGVIKGLILRLRKKKPPPGPVVKPRSDGPRPFNSHPSGVPDDTRLAYFGSNAIYDLGNAPPRPGCVPVYIANGCTLYHYYRDCPQLRAVPDEQIMRVDFRVAQKMGYTACDICRGRIYSGPDKYKMLNQLYGDSQRRPPY